MSVIRTYGNRWLIRSKDEPGRRFLVKCVYEDEAHTRNTLVRNTYRVAIENGVTQEYATKALSLLFPWSII